MEERKDATISLEEDKERLQEENEWLKEHIRLDQELAAMFPDWDLLPPAQMLRRKGSRF